METKSIHQEEKFKILGMPAWFFAVACVIILISSYMGKLPGGMIGAFAYMIALGTIAGILGNNTPIIKDYLGGGPIVAIFGSAFMVYLGIMPEATINVVTDFMKGGGFLSFYIAALICGSILGMDSKLLVKAGARYAVPIIIGVFGSLGLAAVAGGIIGYGWKEAITNIAMPIMGGGMGAGAVPMSQIYSNYLGNNAEYYISILVPALALGNVFAIIAAGLLNKLGKAKPEWSGNGQIMSDFDYKNKEDKEFDIVKMGAGLFISTTFLIVGKLLAIFIPLHYYALMIIAVAICKIFNVVPEFVQEGCHQWYKFVAKNFTLALLIGVGVVYTDLNTVIGAITVQYVIIDAVVIIGAILGAGVGGKLVGFYPIESAITAGLCMANMGGTGDVAVLSASDRMELMPFGQISSRLGGALMLIIGGILVPLLAG
ncbi:2-hydroxycarboxylate transporter family protein [Clostridium sediminicola]|uniref:2-hydroxycarboxylate transporter family protein n=1 Tax=Clostridium sediminicola TaxID=3114879 RepID=UPI0031F22DCA